MRYAVVSDIHANADALHAVLDDAGHVEGVWCLGDIVDIGPEPNECLDLLRARGAVCIYGNHEEWVSGKLPAHLQKTPLEAWALWTNDRLTSDNRAFLDALPEQVTVGDFTLLHFPHPGFNPPTADDLQRFPSRFCLIGHTHLPLLCRFAGGATEPASIEICRPLPGQTVQLEADRAIVNIGSVGNSFCDPRLAYYVIVDQPAKAAPPALTFRAVAYPVEDFVRKLHTSGVPSGLAADRVRGFEGSIPARDRIRALYAAWYPDEEFVTTPV